MECTEEQQGLNQPNPSCALGTDSDLCRIEGNRLFAAGRYLEALKSYTAGIRINPRCPALFTNRAACFMRLKKPLDLVISDCDASINLDKTWWRAYQRKAEALAEHGRYQDADRVIIEALRFNPDQDHFHKQLDQVRSKRYRSENLQAPFGSNLSNFQEVTTNMLDEMKQKMKIPKRLSSAQEKRLHELNQIANVSQKASALEMSGQVAKAIVMYEKSAHAGCTLAMAALGRIFHHGEGLEKPDFERGIFWLKKCVDHGPSELSLMVCDGYDPDFSAAQGLLGQAFRNGIGVEKDIAVAESLLRRSAEGGNIVSMNNLGSLLTCHSNPAEGAHWYLRAANSGYSLAMLNIAVCMMRGQGVQQDNQGARAWLMKAEAAGEPQASTLLAKLIMESGGSPMDVISKLESALAAERRYNQVQVYSLENLAMSLLQSQEQDDDTLSHTQVAHLLRELDIDGDPGANSPTNMKNFVEFSQKHAERLLLLKQIRPITAKETRAIGLLREAIEAGSAEASLRLGAYYHFKRREEDALALYLELSRAKNHGEASFMAGKILTRPGGPLKNMTKGLKLLVKASEQGHHQATQLISSLKQGGESGAVFADAFAGGSGAQQVQQAENGGPGPRGRAASFGADSEKPSQPDDIAAELRRALLLQKEDACMSSNHMRVPGLSDQIANMELYVAAHPESYTGRVMLHALVRFARFHWLWDPENPGPALEQLFFAFALDEKAVSVEYRRHAGGAIAASEMFTLAHKAVERRFHTDEGDLQAALLHAMLRVVPGADSRHSACLAGLNRAVAIGQRAPEASLARRLLPRLFYLRAATRCFRGEPGLGICDFERCRDLLRSDGAAPASLRPFVFDGLQSELKRKDRVVELRSVELDIGRAILLLERPSKAQTRAAADSIRAFIDDVPSDTHYFVNAHYELICALSPGIYKEEGAVQSLVARADAAMGDHIPIFSPVTEESFPKMAMVKALLLAHDLRLAKQQGGQKCDRSKTRGGRAAAQGGGGDSPSAGNGKGARRAEWDSDKDSDPPEQEGPGGCWNCGDKDAAGGLKACKACSTARYCCRECQVKDWSRHRPVCLKISGTASAGRRGGGS